MSTCNLNEFSNGFSWRSIWGNNIPTNWGIKTRTGNGFQQMLSMEPGSLSTNTPTTQILIPPNDIAPFPFVEELKNKTVFIDAAMEDELIAEYLTEYLKTQLIDHGIRLTVPAPQNDPFENLTAQLESCDVVITICDKVPQSWFKARQRLYRIVQVKLKGKRKLANIIYNPKNKPIWQYKGEIINA